MNFLDNSEFIKDFIEEAEVNLETLEQGLLLYEKKQNSEDIVHDLFRSVHSIKGTAGFFDLKTIVKLSHRMESIFGKVRDNKALFSKKQIDLLLNIVDKLRDMVSHPEQSEQIDVEPLLASLESFDSNDTDPERHTYIVNEQEDTTIVENTFIDDSPKSIQPADNQRNEHLEDRIRIHVNVLDDLLNLSSELVLARNQLLSAMQQHEIPGLKNILQNVNNLTTDIQEKVMQTRMQPIEKIYNKFPRMIRELSKQEGKDVEIELLGSDVELDKSILELLNDPLTHLIRNAIDHGIELAEERKKWNKPEIGTIRIEAYHEGGLVHIELSDDGRGIDIKNIKQKAIEKNVVTKQQLAMMREKEILDLIFNPGFSTAEKITNLSGRGVGLDVVKTNIEKISGSIFVQTQKSKGTTFHMSLPLTISIIPALIVEAAQQKFAISQIDIQEMVRVGSNNLQCRVEKLNESKVLRLRDKLYPLVHLKDVLGLKGNNVDQHTQLKILILKSGSDRFGLIVDHIYDVEEVLIKPLPQPISKCFTFSGVTILGDGRVAFIMNADGIVSKAEIKFEDTETAHLYSHQDAAYLEDKQELLLFSASGSETLSMNISLISRVQKIRRSQIEKIGDKLFIQYQGDALRVIHPEDYLPISKEINQAEELYVIVPKLVKHPIGILCEKLYDTHETAVEFNQNDDIQAKGIIGSGILAGKIVMLLNIYELFEMADPEHYSYEMDLIQSEVHVLLAEDTPLFRRLEQQYLESVGYHVIVAENGNEAFEHLKSAIVDVVVTDIEMPIMNGIELARKIRSDNKLANLPIIAVTSLNEESMMDKAMKAGVDYYELKLDKQRLLDKVRLALQKGRCSV